MRNLFIYLISFTVLLINMGTAHGENIIMGQSSSFNTIGTDPVNFYDPGGIPGYMGDNQHALGYFAVNISDTMVLKTNISNSQLYIIFEEFGMGYGDTLFIYDGEGVQSPLVGMYNSVHSPGEIIATGQALTFVFHSDSIMDVAELSSGWKARTYAYHSSPDKCILDVDNNGSSWLTCNSYFYDSGGPDNNIATTGTLWAEFTSPIGTHIKMEFKEFAVNGIMKIYDGLYRDPNKRLIGQFCTSTSAPPVLFSSGPTLSVEYEGNTTDRNKRGWKAEVTCVPELFESPDGSACPNASIMRSEVVAGVNVNTSVDYIEFDCENPVIILNADIVATGTFANDYTIKSIPYDPPFEFNAGTSIDANIDDNWIADVPLPFSFAFFGNSYTHAYPGANGLISFNLPPEGILGFCKWKTEVPPNSPPYSTVPYNYKNCIYGVYEDIYPGHYINNGAIRYDVMGAYPCRTFVFNYNNVGLFSCYSNGDDFYNTYQMVIYEGTNIIDMYIHYRQNCGQWNGAHGVIGLQNNNSSQILTVPGRDFSSPWTAHDEAWRFTPITPMDPDATITWYKNKIHPDSIIGYNKKMVVSPQTTTNYIMEYHYTNATGDDFSLRDTVPIHVSIPKVTLNNTATVGLQTNATYCPGDAVKIDIDIENENNSPTPVGYRWSCGDTTASCIVTPQTTTEYTVTVTYSNACTAVASTTVNVVDIVPPHITGNDRICEGAGTTLTATHATSTDFQWGTGENTPSITVHPNETTDYVVGAILEGNCLATDTFRVYVMPNPKAGFLTNPTDIYVENGVGTVRCSNMSSPGCNLRWDFGDTYSPANVVTDIEEPVYHYTHAGNYTIKLNVTDINGCTDSVSARVTVIVPYFFYVPNSFTPNSDGINERFAPKGQGVDPAHYSMLIYDRTGQIIFKTSDPYDYWDGYAKNGKMCETGVYVYLIRLKTENGEDKEYTGSITLIR